ncbi:acyl-CoA dehydrogenase family protein [Halalkalicoccus subterraneus]|uniref:acyl-CoA dehydrogenase family protein n=1 Tax=Halalkalicoccus subterraneus TaxID=2675002 RepID=UPI000EFD413D|nr:acyl-CoA dehydrogenase family protein [Halalkalicoccus subterraneus]
MELLDESIVPEHARGVKQEAHDFAQQYVAPNAEEYYRTGEYPWEILEAGREAGLVAQDIAENYGGRGFDIAEMLALVEEFFRADPGIGLTLRLASFGGQLVERHGTKDQHEKFLRPVAEGDQITGLAVSEPETGSDLAGMTTRAEKDGDEWVLNGEKYWVGNAVEADWLTVYAKTDDSDHRYSNYSLFIVPTDTDGYEAEHIPEKMAFRASKQGHITFDNCRIPEHNLVGTENKGFYRLVEFFNDERVIVGGHGLGMAAAAIEETWEFVHDREAFGKNVSDFQSVQHDLADMRIDFESARAVNWRAADKALRGEDTSLWGAIVKTNSTETAVTCAERGMQLHGGRSILTDRRIARIYRDCRIPVIYEGANEIQRNLIYSQQVKRNEQS